MEGLRSPAYWIGHFFSVAATIIGVYYAAVVGFDVALELEMVQADRGTYYVAESLSKELEFNVNNMEGYIKKIENKEYVLMEYLTGIQLNDYIFKSAMYSESTFEIEPKLLSEISIFYFAVGNALKVYYDSGKQSPAGLMRVVKAEVKKLAEQNTIARLNAYNKVLADSVEKRGIKLAQPVFE